MSSNDSDFYKVCGGIPGCTTFGGKRKSRRKKGKRRKSRRKARRKSKQKKSRRKSKQKKSKNKNTKKCIMKKCARFLKHHPVLKNRKNKKHLCKKLVKKLIKK